MHARQGGCAALVVCRAAGEEGGPRTGSSFSGRARPVTLEGRDGAPDGPLVATWTVPQCVGRAFGTAPRGFASREAFDGALEALIARTAFERVEAALKTRERSAAETFQKLTGDGFTSAQARAAVDRAVRCGLIDDRRFAEAFIAAKLRAGWGRSRIERELVRAGVDLGSVDGYPEAFFDGASERERARALLARKPVPVNNPVQKLARHLVGKGFDPGMALSLAREHVAGRVSDE